MSLTKAQTLTLASDLAYDLEDDTTISVYFDDVVEYLALTDLPPFIKYAFVEITATTVEYDFESDMLKLLYAFLDDNQMFLTSENALDAYDSDWREVGSTPNTPSAIYQDWLSRQYAIYPYPNVSSGAAAGADELGDDYPVGWLLIFYSEDRASAIQEYYGLPISLLANAREFSHSVLHRDLEFSKACNEVGNLIFKLLGH